MPLPALLAPVAIWGMISTLASLVFRFLKDKIFTLGASLFVGVLVFTVFDMAVETFMEEIRQGIAGQTAMVIGMIGLMGLDDYINIIISGMVAGWTFVISNGVAGAIRQKRYDRYRLQQDKNQLFGKSDEISDAKGTTTVIDANKVKDYDITDYIT